MGLDLILFKRKDFDSMLKNDLPWSEKYELAYGRKTWAIAEWFKVRSQKYEDSPYYFVISRYTWNEFYSAFLPMKNTLKDLTDRYSDLEKIEPKNENELNKQLAESKFIYDMMELILDKVFIDNKGDYTLGADWEANAVVKWLDANDNIQAVYDSGEDIIMDMSY